MMNVENSNVRLVRGHQGVVFADVPPPDGEVPMVLTLDQLKPNPDNPRLSRNPKYDDIKASIRTRGLDTVPKITRDPDGGEHYIFSDGGNTRYQILNELWLETEEERFYRLHCLFKPWSGRLQCVIGHLAENAVRGKMSYIEKALGIQKVRRIYEEQKQKTVSLRELSSLLSTQGLPVHYSGISRMNDTVKYLYPWMPVLLTSGMGAPQIRILLALRQDAESAWHRYEKSTGCPPEQAFDDVFGACCHKFDAPDLWSADMFRDELIGDLLQALPHPALNYDRWLLELNPGERHRRDIQGDTSPLPGLTLSRDTPVILPGSPPSAVAVFSCVSVPDTPDALPHGGDTKIDPVRMMSASTGGKRGQSAERQDVESEGSEDVSVRGGSAGPAPLLARADDSPVFTGDEPVDPTSAGLESAHSLWSLSSRQDDIEHLQGMTFHLAFELAERFQCGAHIQSDATGTQAAGYCRAPFAEVSAFSALLLSLALPHEASPSLMLTRWLTGTPESAGIPVLDDIQVVKLFRLICVLRRLRERQRALPFSDEVNDAQGA